MEQCNDSPFKFSATATVDSCGAKRLPDDILTDIGSNEQRNARSQTITFLKKFVQTSTMMPAKKS
jgi:hypothetical protein